ncbi:hypothetical protein [Desulfonauticus submarinus]|uniref:Uncharacterized protein n=1 Tax=Desulfonauticus submarinus TaxID=206665 RepID=A0A1H0D8Z5_9BACT|nr:hypothetical protein [Desulfonauticus submarinus]SDN66559.1 hypothetical protein SAMN04488516_10475 [Desulfonauticus submarinus]
MFGKLRLFFEKIYKSYRLRKELKPFYFLQETEEILYLAKLAERLLGEDKKFKSRLDKIKQEMLRLQDLTKESAFNKVPLKTKLELKKSLEVSKKQLEETLGFARPHTKIIQ